MECEDMLGDMGFYSSVQTVTEEIDDSTIYGVDKRNSSKRKGMSDNTAQASHCKKKLKPGPNIDTFSACMEAASIRLEKAGLEMSRVEIDIADKTSHLPTALDQL
ncbi:unnamed protein product [Cuscuta epithymum]|uniref:Uncharacterized protein n=1 Tax=Cuscuta epithymum TaxID=186058 RepID=A0AAV0FLD9_9ASTE|nr:unnamed protein product [Cuscuta epithymum]